MFEYRLLPTPTAAKKVKGLKTTADRFAHALAEALNHEANSGWEFVGQERFAVEEKAGMMGKAKETHITYLVFKRGIGEAVSTGGTTPLDIKLQQMKAKREMEAAVAPMAPMAAVAPAMAAAPAMAQTFEEPTIVAPIAQAPTAAPQPFPATQEPFPEPMLSPQAMDQSVGQLAGGSAHANPGFAEELGQRPARIFEPLQTNETHPSDAPNLGPALKD